MLLLYDWILALFLNSFNSYIENLKFYYDIEYNNSNYNSNSHCIWNIANLNLFKYFEIEYT